jgi:histidyl-tRNA synthetase
MSINESIYGSRIAKLLRDNGISAEVDLSFRKAKHQFKAAANSGSKYTIVIGEEEAKTSTITIKNMETRNQVSVKFDEIINRILKDEIL